MKFVRAFITLILFLAVAVTVMFIDFVYKTYSYRQPDVKADAIVVLAGGKGRVEEGGRLYRERRAKYLYFIGVDPSVRRSDLYRAGYGEPGPDNVILEKISKNTLENAIYARDLIARDNVRSILLLTSRYHMKRASILFRNALPRDVTIYLHPVDSPNVKEEWWSYRGSFHLLFREFYKYCMFRFFFLFAPGELRSQTTG